MRWDSLESFSWGWFALYGVIYSALVFGGELSKDGPLIFSQRNSRSVKQVLLLHLSFLTAVLGMYEAAIAMDSYVPNWMSQSAGKGGTWYEGLFLIALLGTSYIERRRLFLEQENSKREDGAAR